MSLAVMIVVILMKFLMLADMQVGEDMVLMEKALIIMILI
jgi:hypothetical protein